MNISAGQLKLIVMLDGKDKWQPYRARIFHKCAKTKKIIFPFVSAYARVVVRNIGYNRAALRAEWITKEQFVIEKIKGNE